MGVWVGHVSGGSPAKKGGIRSGDYITKINGEEVQDVLDLLYFEVEPFWNVELQRDGAPLQFHIENPQGDSFGCEVAERSLLSPKVCRNRCKFCFVDQLPRGMRPTLYVKDDDWRYSFIMGNYITFTNVTEEELQRICRRKFSPLYVSVHATDDPVRRELLGNPAAAPILPLLKRLGESGVQMHTQIVMCPEWNDGRVLEHTLNDLLSLYPQVQSVAVVPVGLTGHRQELFPLKPVDKKIAEDTIALVEAFQQKAKKLHHTNFAYCSDEFYCKAGRETPPAEEYDCTEQLENGVGMLSLYREEFHAGLRLAQSARKESFGLVCGKSAEAFFRRLLQEAKERFPSLQCELYALTNRFFGESITVSGLLTGKDILEQLQSQNLPQHILLPHSILRQFEHVLLDGTSVEDLSAGLQRHVTVCEADGTFLAEMLFD